MERRIYLTNHQLSEEDMIDDIIHELAHAAEETYGMIIYGDGRIEREFLAKREKLWQILSSEGYKVSHEAFLDPEYSLQLDEFFCKEVGYPKMTFLTMDLFASPYGATSINEYFANGFENYFLREQNYLKKISPRLHERVEELIFMEI